MVYLFNFKTSFNFSFNSNSTSNSDSTFNYPTDYISISSEYGYRKLYGVDNFIVSVGTYVNSGDIIGYVGPKYLSNGLLNGNTTGPHLHFSIFKDNSTVNPLEYIKK